MLNRILDIVAKEDTFCLFSSGQSPSINELRRFNLRTTSSIKTALEMFFRNIIENASPDSLYWAEANRLYKFVLKLFQEINEISREGTANDDITDCYIESISEFVEGIEVDLLKEHIRYIMK